MRILLTTVAAILCCTMSVMAEPVSPKVARQAAAKFLNEKGCQLKSEALRAKSRAMGKSTDGKGQTEASAYYVFNAAESKGFVVVSGDDCVGENLVLGYTAQGSFDTNDIPDNLQWWLDEMESQISTLSSLGVKARAVALHDDIAPLMSSLWSQGTPVYNPQNPYNALCPETDGNLCVTGCMATALAQVMYHYRWPKEPIANGLPDYTMANGRVIDGLPAISFDWGNMVDDYAVSTTEAQQTAVATLMRYCGQLLQMDYTPQISNAVYIDTDILVNQFGYAPGMYWAKADEYTVSGWDELIYNELRDGAPVVYAGHSTGGGHAFVIDGYEVKDGDGFFSVNWGWGGLANGFYKINLLAPDYSGTGGSSTKDGYSNTQLALIGLRPQQNPTDESYRYLNSVFWGEENSEHDYLFYFINPSYRPAVYSIALAERNADGSPDDSRLCGEREVEVSGYTTASFLLNDPKGVYTLTLTDDLFSGLAPGNHNLMFVNRESGTTAPWRPIFGPNCYMEVYINDAGKIAGMAYHPQAQLSASSRYLRIDGVKQRGLVQNISASIENKGDDDFIGSVDCCIYQVIGTELKNLVTYSRTGVMIEAGGKSDVYFSAAVPATGEFVLLLTNANKTQVRTDTKLADIKQSPGYLSHKSFSIQDLEFVCQDVVYKEQQDGHGIPVQFFDITVYNGTTMDYDAVLMIKLYKANEAGSYDPVVFPDYPDLYNYMGVNSRTTATVPIYLPEPLESGDYGIDLYIANDFHSVMANDYFIFASGPMSITSTLGIAETTAEGVGSDKWYDLNGRQLSGKPTAKGLYIYKGKKQIVK